MATQYRDGTFGQTLPMKEAMEKFQEGLESGTAKAFHVGTPKEIEKVKTEAAISDQVKELQSRIGDLEAENSRLIYTPSFDEIEKLS